MSSDDVWELCQFSLAILHVLLHHQITIVC